MLLRRYVIPAVLKMLRDLLKNAGTFLTKGKDDYIRVAVQVHDHKELMMGAAAILEGHWAEGRFSQDFSERLAEKMGTRFCLLTNSGSSSNLLALTALTSPLLRGRRLKPGDEVVTVAAGFPTTVNPILQNGLTPVFLDVELGTYNTTLERVRDAIGPKTKAVMLAHALGNPFPVEGIKQLCDEKGLFLVEDCCDAFNSRVNGVRVGSFGDLATLSLYPAHHMTTGEGGAVFTNDVVLRKVVESLRNWGRDCWCMPGMDNTCGQRYNQKHGDLPHGYDHKYVYSHMGYNLKMTNIQAAIGLAQLEKVDGFIAKRKENFGLLRDGLKGLEDRLILPEAAPRAEVSWFGFPLTTRGNERNALLQYLETNGIGSRLLFGGNLTKQPYLAQAPGSYRVAGDLANTDKVMESTFWIGLHPKIGKPQVERMVGRITEFLRGRS